MYLPDGFIYTSLGSRRPKDFGNQIKIKLEVRRRTRAFVCVHSPLLPPPPPPLATQVTAGVVQFKPLALRVISIKFLLVITMLCKTEWSWENGHDHTRWICLILRYQLLSPSSVGNEQGQQMMRIQFLILGEVCKQEISHQMFQKF